MRIRLASVMLITAVLPAFAAAECIPITQAPDQVGATACVTGKVLKVQESRNGTFFLDFCEDYRECPFTVFVPRRNLRDVGDVRQLEGQLIEIHGKIQLYSGRAEIILKELRQLKGEAAKLPPVPKDFDVERRGRYSAGSMSHSKSPKAGQPTTTAPNPQ